MELKHLIITAIVANAAKSGWTEDKRQVAGPDQRNSSGREAVLRNFCYLTEEFGVVTSAGDIRPETRNKQSYHSPLTQRLTASSQSAVSDKRPRAKVAETTPLAMMRDLPFRSSR